MSGEVAAGPAVLARPAALGRRVGAYLIDGVVATLVLAVAAGIFAGISLSTEGAFPLVLAGIGAYVVGAAWFVVYSLMQGGAGSIGMRILGLRLARVGHDAPAGSGQLGFGRALGRNVVWGLGSAIVVGMFSPLFDGSPWRRGWHDKVSGAVMTDIAGRGPLAEEVAAADAETPADDYAAATPTVLPVGPILPTLADPQLEGWTPASAPAPRAATVPDAGVISFVPGVSSPDAAAPPAPPTPRGPVTDPIASIDETRLSTGERPVARLVWDDGTKQALFGRTLFGRNPTPETGAMVTPVRDETLSLSKTHFELAPDDERALWVIDRHSTNGVVLRRGSQRQAAAPGERVRVRAGDVLEFGDRSVRIEVAS